MTTSDQQWELQVGTVVPVWVLCLVGAITIGIASPADQYLTWLPIALAAAVLVTFCIQLSTLTKEGFVNRVMASLGGAVLVIGVATAVLAALAALNG
ncbi:MAG TPA: hypothetical protein VFS93_05330 [Terrimesophilobacter sp.]|nr:hypothetical protein [Terrimesophilobacter sp.]